MPAADTAAFLHQWENKIARFLGSWFRASCFNMYKYIQRDATVSYNNG
jgi:hypothetical protein